MDKLPEEQFKAQIKAQLSEANQKIEELKNC